MKKYHFYHLILNTLIKFWNRNLKLHFNIEEIVLVQTLKSQELHMILIDLLLLKKAIIIKEHLHLTKI